MPSAVVAARNTLQSTYMFFILKSVIVLFATVVHVAGFANVLEVESDTNNPADPVKNVRPIRAFCVASVN